MLDYEDIEKEILPEIDKAKEYADLKVSRRNQSWDRYYGKPLGNEVKGRSKFVTREIMDTIEWMMPYFLRTFASGDTKIDLFIEGQESWIGKGLSQEIIRQLDLGTPNLFLLFYTWFKDALISDTSFIKLAWDLDYEFIEQVFPVVTQQEMQKLYQDRDVRIISEGEAAWSFDIGSPVYQNVKAKIKRKIKDNLIAENTPHWEFIADPRSKDINDEFGKGHKTEVSFDYLRRINRSRGGDYFKDLDSVVSSVEADTGETDTYLEDEEAIAEESLGGVDALLQDPKGRVKFIEWYTKLDVNEDGYLEDVVCYFANDKLIRWEENEDGFVPFCAIKPIVDCFKFYGIAFADLIVEIQNLKTMLLRRILDNFDFQNSGRWRADPGANVNRRELLDNRPGGIVTAKKDGVENLFTGAFNPRSLLVLDYIDKLKENRTGISGLQPQVPTGTATGVVHLQTTVMQRLELIGRIFAETGLRDFFYKAAVLYQKYLSKPFNVKIYGMDKIITPDMLQGRIITKVNMGVETSVGIQESQRLLGVMKVLADLNRGFPGLIGPKQVHNIARRYVSCSGFNVDDFIVDLETYVKTLTQNQQMQMAMQQHLMQTEERLKELELAIQKQEVDVKAGKAAADREIRTAGVIQKNQASQRDFEAKLMKTLSDLQKQEGTRQSGFTY